MWQPPERIKHALPEPGWPTADDAAAARWFQPVRLGPVVLEQRTWVPAMVPWRATEEGFVSPEVLGWYERFAKGQPGALVVEATGVRDVPSGPLLRASHDRFVAGLTELARVVRAASAGRTKLFVQLIDFLAIKRRVEREKYLRRFLTITDEHRRALPDPDAPEDDVREALVALAPADLDALLNERERESLHQGWRERVTDLDAPHVRDLPTTLPATFAAAAARCEEAGFDGVELHCAHAYTLASFLSARNDRPDGWGGSRENRARLPLEVHRAVHAAVSPRFAVGARFLTDECIPGGSTVDDARYFGVAFARAGFHFLSLSRGGKFEDARQPKVGQAAYPYTGPSGYECMPTVYSDARGPFGRNVAAAAEVRAAIRAAGHDTPTVLAGGIVGFVQAEEILRREQADIVGAARQSLADPDWFLKVRLGRGADVRRCQLTNYCEALDQRHVPVTCQLWDRLDLENEDAAKTPDGRRRLLAPEWTT